jgi:hypothetical protein
VRDVRQERNPMKKFEVVIVGGGLAAARAIKSYRDSSGSGQIALLSKESDLPYHRRASSRRRSHGDTPTTNRSPPAPKATPRA